MSYRKRKALHPKNARANHDEQGRSVIVTLCEGKMSVSTEAGLQGKLYPGFTHAAYTYEILEVEVVTIWLTRDVGITRTVYCLIRNSDPHNLEELPDLFVNSTPKVLLELSDGQFYTRRIERVRGELKRVKGERGA